MKRFLLCLVGMVGLVLLAQTVNAALTTPQYDRLIQAVRDNDTADAIRDGVDFANSIAAGGVTQAEVDYLDGVTASLVFYPATLTTNFVGVAASTCKDSAAIAVTGAAASDICSVGAPLTDTGKLSITCYVSAADQVKVRLCNPAGSVTATGGSAAYKVRVWDT